MELLDEVIDKNLKSLNDMEVTKENEDTYKTLANVTTNLLDKKCELEKIKSSNEIYKLLSFTITINKIKIFVNKILA